MGRARAHADDESLVGLSEQIVEGRASIGCIFRLDNMRSNRSGRALMRTIAIASDSHARLKKLAGIRRILRRDAHGHRLQALKAS